MPYLLQVRKIATSDQKYRLFIELWTLLPNANTGHNLHKITIEIDLEIGQINSNNRA